MRSRSRPLAALVAFLLALALVACGGGSDVSSTAGTASRPAKDAGEPSRGGEASIEEFGAEATAAEREEILAAFHGYLDAIAERNYGTACSRLSSNVHTSLEAVAPKPLKAKGCEGILPELLAPSAAQIARQESNGEVTKVRVEGDRGFVVFKAPGAKRFQMTMVREGGEWKIAIVSAGILVPEL